MSLLDTEDPLYGVVRDALCDYAEQAPDLPDDWSGPAITVAPAAQRRRRWTTEAAVAAAAVVLVVALALVPRQRGESTTAGWTPPGTEFASTDLGPVTVSHLGPVVAALSRQVGIEGHPLQLITTSLSYMGHATAVELVCTSEGGGSGCRPEWNTTGWSTSITSSVDNGYSTFDLWTVDGLPANVAFVVYADGGQQLWQRPIFGFAAFPNIPGDDEIVIGYDEAGNEVGRFGAQERAAMTFTGQAPHVADLSTTELQELGERTHDETRRCLADRGATVDSDVATFADDVDQTSIWRQCVSEVKQIVGDAVDQLEPRFYDPTTERPLNPDPAIQVEQPLGGESTRSN